jgi:hypothetical protein
MPGLGGTTQRSLGDGRALMDLRMAMVLFGAMAASMVRLVRVFFSFRKGVSQPLHQLMHTAFY